MITGALIALTFMILDLLKYGVIFFLPAILSRTVKFYNEAKPFSFSFKKRNLNEKIIGIGVCLYIVAKLVSIFLIGTENFFIKINARIDSPSYIIRNQFRSFLNIWSESDERIKEILAMKEKKADTTAFEDDVLYNEFSKLEFLSEQLKIKERKLMYSRYGENAFVNCSYCQVDNDYMMYLIPSTLFEYSLFLLIVGILTSLTAKSRWRFYGLVCAFLSAATEVSAFVLYSSSPTGLEIYDYIFGDDYFTLRFEKIRFIRDVFLLSFLLVSLLLDYSKDSRLSNIIDRLKKTSENSLAFLQAVRVQALAISIDENLRKYTKDSKFKQPKLDSILSDPEFRQKISEAGPMFDVDELMKQKHNDIDFLLSLTKK